MVGRSCIGGEREVPQRIARVACQENRHRVRRSHDKSASELRNRIAGREYSRHESGPASPEHVLLAEVVSVPETSGANLEAVSEWIAERYPLP
jgi:hypothetical protein